MKEMKFEQSKIPQTISLGKAWLIAILISILGVSTNEALLRAAGHPPTVVSDSDLWALARTEVDDLNQDAIVLLGASRMQTNVDTAFLREQCPGSSIVQLAMSGRGSPYPVFQDIVDNSGFNGLIIISETESTIGDVASSQSDFVQRYREGFRFEAQLNRRLRNLVELNLRSTTPYGSSVRIFGNLLENHRLPYPFHVSTAVDRSQEARFELMDPEILAEIRGADRTTVVPPTEAASGTTSEDFLREAEASYGDELRRFQNRGGQVIFVRMPVDSQRWSTERLLWPVTSYWGVLSDRLGAPTVHFQDMPGWEDYSLPDRSHLDVSEKTKFTADLLALMETQMPSIIESRCSVRHK